MNKINNHITLKINNLSIGYYFKKKQEIIVSNISVALTSGIFVCVLGKNGVGKSTLLRTLSKIQPKLSGIIEIDGISIEAMSSLKLAQKISLVLTERIPENNLTVYELIALGRQPYTNWLGALTKEDYKQIDTAIGHTNLTALIHKKCDELSDGQLQKVMIARALAQNTEIIILDEPTAHLDIHHKIEVFTLLKRLVKEFKKTIIISTHEIQLALQTADTLWLLKENHFIADSTEALLANDELHDLFDSTLVKFDAKTKQFIINS